MPASANTNILPLNAEFIAAEASIESALEQVEEGTLYSVADIQLYIEKLCVRIQELPGTEQTATKNRIVDLLVSLDKLTDKLVEQKDALSTQIASLPNSVRAATAYIKAAQNPLPSDSKAQ